MSAVNPSGKVPILKIKGAVIIDSVAICQFLTDRHSNFTYKAGTIERALQDSWTNFAIDEVDAPLRVNAKNDFIFPEELRSETAQRACKYDFDRAMDVFSTRLGDHMYVMGDEFTVSDLLLGHCAGWAVNGAGWEIPEGKVSDYFQRVRARPACLKALEIRERAT
ncbi:MAG: glutathione S-transferase family protein [Hyphomicrobiales bacterium]